VTTTAGPPLPARAEARWFRRPAFVAAARVWHETVTVQGAAFPGQAAGAAPAQRADERHRALPRAA
jgi:hypothetical protein